MNLKKDQKICRVCKKTKFLDEFYFRKDSRKHRNECKTCSYDVQKSRLSIGYQLESKKCNNCKRELPPESFNKDLWGVGRLSDWCKECISTDHQSNSLQDQKNDFEDSRIKRCSTCKETKSVSRFSKNKNNKDGFSRSCYDCFNKWERGVKNSNPLAYQSKQRSLRQKRMLRPESVAERMLTNAKQRAKRKGSYVSISKEWILERIIKGKCEVTGLDFTLGGGYGSGRSSFNSFNPSLDRIDPNRGYSPENSRVVVNVYNTTKHRWNDQDVLVYCKALLGRTFDYYLSDVENNMRFKTLRGLAYSRYIKAKRTAKEKILDFNISIDWVEERIKRGICEITNLRFVTNIPYHPFQPSLDKIDPMKGYTTENTRVVVYIHNWGRQRSSDQDMMILAKSLIK